MAKRGVQYQVRDFETFRKAFEANEPARAAATMSNARIYRNVADPNDVVVLLDVADPEKARKYRDSPELTEVRKRAGVTSQPVYLTEN
jgi:hypothetical protein